MYLYEIINQLRSEIPLYSNSFSEQVAISTISFSGGVVTVVTSAAHGLTTGDSVTIVGAKEKILITDITTIANIATVTTQTPHDLTMDYQNISEQPPIDIVECSVGAYNGTWNLIDVITRKNFKFNVGSTPAQATDGYVLQDSHARYSGVKEVTVIDTTTFTFVHTGDLPASGYGGVVHKNIRIAGAVDIDRTIEAYTKQLTGTYWMFVTPESVSASRSRHTMNDATSQKTLGDEYRQNLIPGFNVFMFLPNYGKISGREAHDNVILESIGLFKALLSWKAPSPYSIERYSGVVFENHAPEAYNTATYVHKFAFSTLYEIVSSDAYKPKNDRAFRDFEFDTTPALGDEKTETGLKLDE